MVNNSININKANNPSYKYRSGLGASKKCCRIKPVNGTPTFPSW